MFTKADSNWKVTAPDPSTLNPRRNQMPSCAIVPLVYIGADSCEGQAPSLAAPEVNSLVYLKSDLDLLSWKARNNLITTGKMEKRGTVSAHNDVYKEASQS